ncbi:LysE family translocator [Oleisolibacter albus]|uniref:LysE family translocator n=1 Tax=Oleisolibacter albus TaxID=2171757 RepID=UPI000DF39FED|nr:LysE family translocator [Oleisolibacter albus]
MSLESLVALALTLAVFAVTPGPGMLAVMSCAVARGFRPALALGAGLVLGDLVYMTLSVQGMAHLAQALGGMFLAVKLAGAAYVLWMGVKAWRAVPQLPAAAEAEGGPGAGRTFLAGLAVTLGNPKTILFYMGFLPNFIDVGRVGPADLALLAGIVVVVVGGVALVYARAAAQMRALLTSRRRVLWMNRAAGTAMIGTGLAIALKR